MSRVAPLGRLASASVVFFGQHGDVSRHAAEQGISRQRLYRQADGVLRDLDPLPHQQQLARLQQQVVDLQRRLEGLQAQQPFRFFQGADKQAEFASMAQAEGVSLPLARRLLHLLLREATPSVAQLGRWAKAAALRATATLEALDEVSRPLIKDAALDELNACRKPLLMAVELGSLVWAKGLLSKTRDGEAWAEQLRKLPSLQFVSRDAGTGLDAGIRRVNASRAEQQKGPLDDQDDHFHLLREGTRALRRLQGPVTRALEKAEKADRKRAKVERQGRTASGTGSVAARAWRKAEVAFQRFGEADEAWKRVRQEALPLFGPSGQLNTRAKAEAVLAFVLPKLDGREWAKVRRLLKRPGFFTFLDRVSGELAALPAAKELVQAAVEVEGARRRPEASAGPGASAQGYRAVVLVAGVMLALAGDGGAQALSGVRGVLRRAYRASSAVEGLNSVVRMHQGRHRRLTQGLLDLKRLNWNCRPFRTGQRQRHTPYALLGLKLPTSDWWQLIKIPPQELRQHLSGQQPPP
jgi:hypothetical protein